MLGYAGKPRQLTQPTGLPHQVARFSKPQPIGLIHLTGFKNLSGAVSAA
jgi:hypothetical protein